MKLPKLTEFYQKCFLMKEKQELKNDSIHASMFEKLMFGKLAKHVKRASDAWDTSPEYVYMMLKIRDGEPYCHVGNTQNDKSIDLTGKMGILEDLGKLAFEKLLKICEKQAAYWETEREYVILLLKIKVDKKPFLRIQEEGGLRRKIDLDI